MIALLALPAMILGYLLDSVPSDPDKYFSLAGYLGAASIFSAFLLSVLAWGRVLTTALGIRVRSLGIDAAIGSAATALLVALLGALHLVGYGSRWLLIAVLLLGPILNLKRSPAIWLAPWRKHLEKPARLDGVPAALVLLATLVAVGITIKSVLFLNFHTDAIYYHLLGPRLWASSGSISAPDGMPLVVQCSYWEYLYLAGQMLLGGPGNGGLIEAHYFAQWSHVALGYVGSLLLLDVLLARFQAPLLWRRVGVFAAACGGIVNWTGWAAKNDLGAMLWALGGLVLLDESPVVGFALLGVAVAAKVSSIIFVAPVAAAWLWRKREPRTVLVAAAAGFGVTLPIFARNWLWMGNPVFPWAHRFFGTPWAGHYFSAVTVASEPWWAFARHVPQELRVLYNNEFALTILLATALVGWLPVGPRKSAVRHREPGRAAWWAALVGTLVLHRVATRNLSDDGMMSLRYLGAALPFAAGVAAVSAGALLSRRRVPLKAQLALIAFIIVGGLARVHTPPGLQRDQNEAIALRTLLKAGQGKAWIRMNIGSGESVASTGDSHLYYLADVPFYLIPTQPYLDALARGLSDPYELAFRLRDLGVRYILDGASALSPSGSSGAVPFALIAALNPQALAFSDSVSTVLDLRRLDDVPGGRCYDIRL